jgi:acyl-CoA hydrolase
MHDPKKIEDAVLPLLGAFEFENGRAWKRFDFDVMLSLADQGLISDPKGKSESVRLTPEGMARAKALADRLFSP